jgi:hypothetical protein
MVFEGDCGLSTVLEALRVASTAGPSAPTLRRLWVPGGGCRLEDVKSEIRNPKSEIAGATGHRMNPHSLQFSRLLGVMSEQLKNSLSLFFTSSILLGVRNPVRVSSCVGIDEL